jgi:hypothetical protein
MLNKRTVAANSTDDLRRFCYIIENPRRFEATPGRAAQRRTFSPTLVPARG